MKRLFALLLACIMIIPALVGCATSERIDLPSEAISSGAFTQLNATEQIQEITVYPVEKAYVRGGSNWEHKNWREIIKERGINQNNAEPLVIKHWTDLNYMRQIYFTFDVSEFDSIP